jgi:hypothetical protein
MTLMRIVYTVSLLVLSLCVAPVSASADDSWQVDLSRPVATGRMLGEVHIVYFASYTMRTPANRFVAEVDGAGVAVDVRGVGPRGEWTEWAETPADLPAVVTTVQVRVVREPGSTLRGVAMRPSVGAGSPSVRAPDAGLTYEVFATREGLVGGRTASGHIIVERDHFAALPSRRGLSTKDTGDYTVRVCAKNGRCEWAPVWDVGPWNTKDDYWNPAGTRQMWADLPQGRPQAQAARQDGYNGGLDQFGRTVRNPAGIDLADGMFWDGLQLKNNAWVTVTFVWTGTGPTGRVHAGTPLHLFDDTHVAAPVVGLAADLAQVRVECQKSGETHTGPEGTTDIWYRLAPTMWAAAGYVSGVTGAPTC